MFFILFRLKPTSNDGKLSEAMLLVAGGKSTSSEQQESSLETTFYSRSYISCGKHCFAYHKLTVIEFKMCIFFIAEVDCITLRTFLHLSSEVFHDVANKFFINYVVTLLLNRSLSSDSILHIFPPLQGKCKLLPSLTPCCIIAWSTPA